MASINYEGWYVTEGDNPDSEKQYLKLTGSYSYKNKSEKFEEALSEWKENYK